MSHSWIVEQLSDWRLRLIAITILGEQLKWNHLAAFICILGAVLFTFVPRQS